MQEVIELINALGRNDEVLVLGGLAVCGVTGIVFGTVASVMNNMSREKTRREMSAYIAEGSITPEDGERILRVGLEEEE